MKIYKTRNVKTPERGTPGSAGFDFFVPEDFQGTHYLVTGQSVTVPSGIIAKVPEGFALVAFNKSGLASKGLQVGACVIDSDYQGEILIQVRNVGLDLLEITPGMKLIQFLLLPVPAEGIEEAQSLADLFPAKTERGAGGFGSTGK